MATLVIVFCGLLIGLAVYLFVRSVRSLTRGRCCEGCAGCPHAEGCEAAAPDRECPEPARKAGAGNSQ